MIIINPQHLERAIREVVIITVGLNTFGGHVVERKYSISWKTVQTWKLFLAAASCFWLFYSCFNDRQWWIAAHLCTCLGMREILLFHPPTRLKPWYSREVKILQQSWFSWLNISHLSPSTDPSHPSRQGGLHNSGAVQTQCDSTSISVGQTHLQHSFCWGRPKEMPLVTQTLQECEGWWGSFWETAHTVLQNETSSLSILIFSLIVY